MHPSLLPKYRGACPIQHTILNGEVNAGVSLIEISKGRFDEGKILMQRGVPFDWKTTKFDELQQTLSILGGEVLADVLVDFDNCYDNGLD